MVPLSGYRKNAPNRVERTRCDDGVFPVTVVARAAHAERYAFHLEPRFATLTELPKNLAVPIDDGACNHLFGKALPSIELASTKGRSINLAKEASIVVVYCYPMTGRPDMALPKGWDQIPGATGSC